MTSPIDRQGSTATPRQAEVWCEQQGARLFALDLGSGPPTVFLHGGLADHRAGLFRLGELAASQRLLFPDLRGSGRSVYGGELSWDVLADDVCALLDQLRIERAVVGGMSMGSAVALRFALRRPDRIRGLIVWSPVYAGADRGLSAAQQAAMQLMDAAAQSAMQHGIEALRPLYDRLPEPIRERALDMMRGFDPASVAATTRFLATGEQPFLHAGELVVIDQPVLVIAGNDPEHPPEIAALYARSLRRAVVLSPDRPDLLQRIDAFTSALEP